MLSFQFKPKILFKSTLIIDIFFKANRVSESNVYTQKKQGQPNDNQ